MEGIGQNQWWFCCSPPQPPAAVSMWPSLHPSDPSTPCSLRAYRTLTLSCSSMDAQSPRGLSPIPRRALGCAVRAPCSSPVPAGWLLVRKSLSGGTNPAELFLIAYCDEMLPLQKIQSLSSISSVPFVAGTLPFFSLFSQGFVSAVQSVSVK